MKKLMIAAVAIAFAAVAHAASVSWTLAKDDPKTYGNSTVYVVDGSNYSAILTLLAAGSDDVATQFNEYVLDSQTMNSRGAGGGEAVGVTSDSIAFFIFKDNKIESGSTYDTTGTKSVVGLTYTPPESSPADLELQVSDFALTGQNVGPAEPEPTSALLMLCGLAGLALRRKRA